MPIRKNHDDSDSQIRSGYVFAPGATPTPKPTAEGDEQGPRAEDADTHPRLKRSGGSPAAKKPSIATTDLGIREERIPCSFPGMLKILIPEKSFSPISIPVRVANISPSGAMVEIHDRAQLDRHIALPNRFFELKVAQPEFPLLRGSIAWSDLSRANPTLGLMCFERYAKLAELVNQADSGTVTFEGPPPLPVPSLELVPTVVRDTKLVLKGRAPEALEVVLKGDEKKFTAKVINDSFEITAELEPDAENSFSLRSVAGLRKSRAFPIQVSCEINIKRGRIHFDTKMANMEGGGSSVTMDFAGSVRHAERILFRLSQLLASADRVELEAKLESLGGFEKRMFEALKSEGAVLSADSNKNEAAAKLLEELL